MNRNQHVGGSNPLAGSRENEEPREFLAPVVFKFFFDFHWCAYGVPNLKKQFF